MLENIIATVVLVAILGGAVAYLVKAKKSGQKCIGCPHSKTCASQKSKNNEGCGCGCGCGESDKNK